MRKPREMLRAPRPVLPPQHPEGSYNLNFAQHLRSVRSRRRSDPARLPEEPFVPAHCPASVKFFCLFGLTGKKFTLRSIGELLGFPKVPQLLLGEAASLLCSGHPRTGQINSVLAAFAHVWRCRGAALCSAKVG